MPTLTREFIAAARPYLTGEAEAFATTLLSILLRAYGVDVFEWDPITVQMELKDDFGVEPPRRVFDKLMGLLSALSTDRIYKDVAVFDETVNALSGHGAGVDRDIPSVDEVAWAVAELTMADPEPVTRNPEQPFGRDIQKYVRVVLDNEGMTIAPNVLGFAQSRAPKAEGNADPDLFSGAWGAAQARGDEVDQWVEQMTGKLLQQLQSLGISFQQKVAEWTSHINAKNHVEKHGLEFGGLDEYATAERHYSARDPGQVIESERSCETDENGSTRCKVRTLYDDGVVRVADADSNRTITLFRRHPEMHNHLQELAKARSGASRR